MEAVLEKYAYLTDMPQEFENYGLCKVLLVRKEVIRYKHIFTEIFVKKRIDIKPMLKKLNLSLFDYIEYMTNILRKIHYIPREYTYDINKIVKKDLDNFFPTIELYSKLNNLIVLDFDGVVTDPQFKKLYDLCLYRNKTVICSANPTITQEWFLNRNYNLPDKIFSNKGKVKKIKKILELNLKYDNIFYVDDEIEYLTYAWIFNIKTYHYKNGKIKYFTLEKN